MANFQSHQKKARAISPKKVSKDFYKYVKALEHLFFNLNIIQLEDSKDSKGKLLKNKNKRFRGVYAQATEEIAKTESPKAPKKAGEPYNFLYHGDFFKGFKMFESTGSIDIFSTGTGIGDKKEFFDGYEFLFGLTDKNLQEVINDKLLPFLIQYYKDKLL